MPDTEASSTPYGQIHTWMDIPDSAPHSDKVRETLNGRRTFQTDRCDRGTTSPGPVPGTVGTPGNAEDDYFRAGSSPPLSRSMPLTGLGARLADRAGRRID